jgi:hypothetical protein
MVAEDRGASNASPYSMVHGAWCMLTSAVVAPMHTARKSTVAHYRGLFASLLGFARPLCGPTATHACGGTLCNAAHQRMCAVGGSVVD